MTGGNVVVLGKIGRNFGAGMSGGVAYIYKCNDFSNNNFNMQMINLEKLNNQDEDFTLELIQKHFSHTNSNIAENIIQNWDKEKLNFIKVMPEDYKLALERLASEKINQLVK